MKILLVGASGTIGQAVVKELGPRHEIIKAGSRGGDVTVDITDEASIKALFEQLGHVDAVVCTAGAGFFGPFAQLTAETCQVGIKSKLMGQVNLVLIGRDYVTDGGSFTLTSGILSFDPVKGGAGLSLVNGAINGFVVGAAIELPRGMRINAVSPDVLVESVPKLGVYFRGHVPVRAEKVAFAYSKSVEGALTGQVLSVTE